MKTEFHTAGRVGDEDAFRFRSLMIHRLGQFHRVKPQAPPHSERLHFMLPPQHSPLSAEAKIHNVLSALCRRPRLARRALQLSLSHRPHNYTGVVGGYREGASTRRELPQRLKRWMYPCETIIVPKWT